MASILWKLGDVKRDRRKGVVDVAQGKVIRSSKNRYSMFEVLSA